MAIVDKVKKKRKYLISFSFLKFLKDKKYFIKKSIPKINIIELWRQSCLTTKFVKYEMNVNKNIPYNPTYPIFVFLLYVKKFFAKKYPYPRILKVNKKYVKIKKINSILASFFS